MSKAEKQKVKPEEVAIKVSNVSKTFKLPHEKQSSIKGLFVNMFRGKRTYEKQQVLNDISFEVKKGEFFGIVGRNGSGKSTLLKLLAGIYTPDSGHIQVNGKLTPFIELGVGFNPELTGRENVFLNGALLGFNRKEMEAMYDEIVEFAELEKFMDQKLKNYSSGMQVRLAFSIAIRANTEILVLDEVLAVGDEAFQRKCNSYFNTLKKEKKTVILVTHSMAAVEQFCTRAMLIQDGIIEKVDSPHLVAAAYSKSNDVEYLRKASKFKNNGTSYDGINIELLNSKDQKQSKFAYNDTMKVRLRWKVEGVKYGGVAIFRENGEYVFGPSTYYDRHELAKNNELTYEVELNIGEGEYFIKVGLTGEDDVERLAFVEEGPHFIVTRDSEEVKWGGVTKLKYKWL